LLHKLLALVHRPRNDRFTGPACPEFSQLALEVEGAGLPPCEAFIPTLEELQVGSPAAVAAALLGLTEASEDAATNGVADGLRGLLLVPSDEFCRVPEMEGTRDSEEEG